MPPVFVASLPLLLLILLAVWVNRMARQAKQLQPLPYWPWAGNPNLALELADSSQFIDALLGEQGQPRGEQNRRIAARLQRLDFAFIPLYLLFFAASAWQGLTDVWKGTIVALALMTGLLDVLENRAILRMLQPGSGTPARRFGQPKWVFYFLLFGAAGLPYLLPSGRLTARSVLAELLGLLVVLTATAGIWSSLHANFHGIASAAGMSAFGLVGLALAPLIALSPISLRVAAEYAFLLRIPLLIGGALVALPFLAVRTGARSLLRGLFDLTPWSLFVVALSAVAAAGTACSTASLVLLHGPERMNAPPLPDAVLLSSAQWLWVVMVLSLCVLLPALIFSIKEGHGLWQSLLGAVAGYGVGTGLAGLVAVHGLRTVEIVRVSPILRWVEQNLSDTGLFRGYVKQNALPAADPFVDHLNAGLAFLCVLVLYIALGFYGRFTLGRKRTIPALCSAIMVLMMVGWSLSAVAFFFDAWRVPVLLIVLVVGTFTAQSVRSDHFYHLRARLSKAPAPDAASTLTATGEKRLIVVAANGGGIQAGAWAAQVLQGLLDDCGAPFARSLRLISSVSGGSVGTACFVHWLERANEARLPADAAAQSSLDEVAWGLAWPDLLRALAPWIFGGMIGRGRALETAWCLNSAQRVSDRGRMDEPLSSWNDAVAHGTLPAVVMNATLSETGERLLLATTSLGNPGVVGRARVSATELHTINGQLLDVGVVTAARLSASFPYVTPAARADAPGPQPHVVDGGYYDNYGMSTLVEWLDAALQGSLGQVERVLVIQILGAPVQRDMAQRRHSKGRGWFYQAFAPLTTLAAVRSAGQMAHNDIELELLQQKWSATIPIQTVSFEFGHADAPLSWHLTPSEIQNIRTSWAGEMQACRQQVKDFLQGGGQTRAATN